MRIIAGKHKSRILYSLEGKETRPMMDRMKESVFNTIGPYFEGDVVLDLFGGSGALCLEAISRGASKGLIVEKSKDAIRVIRENIKLLKEEDSINLFNSSYEMVLNRLAKDKTTFDIIFLDPPYELNIINDLITYILDNNLLNEGGVIVCHYVKGNFKSSDVDRLVLIKNYNYGKSEVSIFKKDNN
ncbi:MAG: 16S rRNA (guanine(966)-N(2))-methyltransferase RsmD [Bacilli bacterium]|nr:16S rRNA (guanine(966)-N(2))-methyltransferase RsmD [Bacilli bacterium]